MFQVTAIYENGEIGYGEGETIAYAIDDCAASIPAIFEDEFVKLSIIENDVKRESVAQVYIDINGNSAFIY